MKSRARQHQSIDQSHRHADIDSLPQCPQHPAGLRTVNDESISHARVAGGNYEGLSVNSKADVTDKTLVQNLVDYFSIVAAALRQALQRCAQSLRNLFHFSPRLARY